MSERIAVIAAHPDDEALGCGGTMARFAASGAEIHVIFVADGEGARGATDRIAARQAMAADAALRLGAQAPRFLDFADNRLDGADLLDIVQAIEAELRSIAPTIVYTHHGGDLNIDHRLVHDAVLTACRPLPGSGVRAIYGFEVLSSTEWGAPDSMPAFRPTRFVGIGAHLPDKLAALEAYGPEIRPFPHPRSASAVEALARYRGAQSGLTAAEAFSVLREIDP